MEPDTARFVYYKTNYANARVHRVWVHWPGVVTAQVVVYRFVHDPVGVPLCVVGNDDRQWHHALGIREHPVQKHDGPLADRAEAGARRFAGGIRSGRVGVEKMMTAKAGAQRVTVEACAQTRASNSCDNVNLSTTAFPCSTLCEWFVLKHTGKVCELASD